MVQVVRYAPDAGQRQMVEMMVGVGVPEADIARVLGVDLATLHRHYGMEIQTGQIVANARVAESLYRKAVSDGPQSVTAAMFWLKTRAGWREADAHPGRRVEARVHVMNATKPNAAAEAFKRRIEMMARNISNDG